MTDADEEFEKDFDQGRKSIDRRRVRRIVISVLVLVSLIIAAVAIGYGWGWDSRSRLICTESGGEWDSFQQTCTQVQP